MKRLIGAAILAATFAVGGALAASPGIAASSQSHQPSAQQQSAAPMTDISAQRRHYRHRHYRHRHYRPYYYGPRYSYRPYYYAPRYRPYYYAPRPHFGFGFGFGPRYYW
jgi:hypothetical protein